MYVPDALKLNKFVDAKLPTIEALFNRFGSAPAPSQSGDEEGIFNGRKLDEINRMEAYDRYMQQQETEKAEREAREAARKADESFRKSSKSSESHDSE